MLGAETVKMQTLLTLVLVICAWSKVTGLKTGSNTDLSLLFHHETAWWPNYGACSLCIMYMFHYIYMYTVKKGHCGHCVCVICEFEMFFLKVGRFVGHAVIAFCAGSKSLGSVYMHCLQKFCLSEGIPGDTDDMGAVIGGSLGSYRLS